VIERATMREYAAIVGALDRYWPSADAAPIHHPLLVREFGDLSLVIRDDWGVAAYLFGLMATAEPVAYVHVVGVRRDRRREGLATALYGEFERRAHGREVGAIKAITRPSNTRSRAFHAAVGFDEAFVADYAGPGEDRIVLRKPLAL
jgi:ribosomal protein S18 acetylase RimI-like enzyme